MQNAMMSSTRAGRSSLASTLHLLTRGSYYRCWTGGTLFLAVPWEGLLAVKYALSSCSEVSSFAGLVALRILHSCPLAVCLFVGPVVLLRKNSVFMPASRALGRPSLARIVLYLLAMHNVPFKSREEQATSPI
jgi:hypothetical protein